MTLFMAFFLLLLLFEENLPPSATSVPVLGMLYKRSLAPLLYYLLHIFSLCEYLLLQNKDGVIR